MANGNADRNLLFGILAVQMDFLGRDALIAAMNAWVLDKAKPLGQVLVDQGALGKERRALLDALVQEHLNAHHNDPEKSLAAAGCAIPVRDALRQVADADIHASLGCLPPPAAAAGDLYATRAAGETTSSGLRFRILRPHAKGGLGEVLVAEDEELHREVALKHIQDQLADQPESRARFLLEAEITGGLEHPGIVPVYGLGQYGDGRPFYAMRFIRGDSLKDVIARFHKADRPGRDPGERTLKLHELLQRFVAVCNAIAYAHSRGVLHRDLKPGNIMLGQYGETLVVDWGLAKVAGPEMPSELPPLTPHSSGSMDATLPGQMVGTPAYMAPEQAEGRLDHIDERTDVYGLGAILFEILAGRAPHEGSNVFEVLKSVGSDPTPRVRSVAPSAHPALEAVCAKAMASHRNARYHRAAELAADVQRFLADEPVGAWREPWRVRTRRWVGRHRTFVTASAAVVVAAVVLLAASSVVLQDAYKREASAHAEAEKNYQLARSAVDRYYTEVSENTLLREPGMEPLRKTLLEAAREFYDKFVQERGNDPTAREDLAKALDRLARITGDIDSQQRAIDLELQALPIFKDLHAKHPDDADRESALAGCFQHLGRMYRLSDRPADAEDAYKNALELWTRLVLYHPHEDSYQAGLARGEVGLANVYQAARRMDDAADLYEKALGRRQDLSKAHPDDPEYQREVGVTQHNLALASQALGRNEKAENAYLGALKIQGQLAHDHPAVKQYKNDLARSTLNLAQLRAKGGRFDQAEILYGQAASLWKELSQQNPAVLDYAMSLAEAYWGLAEASYDADKLEQAGEAGRKCLDLRQKLADVHADLDSCQGDLARTHYLLGKVLAADNQRDKAESSLLEARRLQEPLAARHSDSPQYQEDLANTDNELGQLHLAGGDATAAGEDLHKALDLWKPLADAHPDQPEIVQGLAACTYGLGALSLTEGGSEAAVDWFTRCLDTLQGAGTGPGGQVVAGSIERNAHWKRAESLVQMHRYERAVPDWDQAVERTTDPEEKGWICMGRARTLALEGECGKAAAEAQGLTQAALNSGKALYRIACVFSLCAAATAGLPPDQRQKVADGYAEQALDLLRKARAAGFFQDSVGRELLRKDPDLDGLRARPEFKDWLNAF